jgi:hypothetical protein
MSATGTQIVVTARFRPGWLQPDGRIGDDRTQLSRDVLAILPEIVTEVIGEIDGIDPTLMGVNIDPQVTHPLATGFADWWFTVSPDEIEGTTAERQQRRFAIASMVTKAVAEFIADKGVFKPALDIECVPTSRSGLYSDVRDDAHFTSSTWGEPEAA